MLKANKAYFRKLLSDSIAQSTEMEEVLDIACATAKFAHLFSAHRYTGVDSSSSKIRQAAVEHPQARFVCADLTDATLDVGTFDMVVCTHTLHHLPDELKTRAVDNLFRALRPNGRLLLQLSDGDFKLLMSKLQDKFSTVSHHAYGGLLMRGLWRLPIPGKVLDLVARIDIYPKDHMLILAPNADLENRDASD